MGGDDGNPRPLTWWASFFRIFTVKTRYLLPFAAVYLMAVSPAVPPGQATPVAHPYDETADAHAQVDAALAEGKRTGRTVLLDFGGNWCPDCRMLAGVFQEKPVADWMAQHFVVLTVDIGRRNKNMDISQRWGVTIQGVPTVMMISPQGKLLNKDDPYGLADARSMSTQAVVDLLAKMAKS
jgi:thiol:disulfide interchange protein